MRIEVRVFAHFVRHLPPEDRREKRSILDLPEGARMSDAIEHIGIPRDEVSLLMRNGRQVSEEENLAEGDVVGIFPPIAGGAEGSWGRADRREWLADALLSDIPTPI